MTVATLVAQTPYKQIHRNCLKRIVDGKAGAVAKQLRERIAADPGDGEDWFMLAIATVKAGQKDEAVTAISRALDLGIPEGRVAAASVDWLRPIAERAPLAALRERMKGKVTMGPMVGHTSTRKVHIWVRTMEEAVITASIGDRIAASGRTKAALDHTLVLEIEGLEPSTRYSGTIAVGSTPDPNATFSFKTPPERGAREPFTLAFGGGAGFTPQYEHMWDTIGRQDPDFMLLLGDNVYIDHPEHSDVQRFCYHRRQGSPPYRRLLRHTPTWSIWDDHDFGTNDCHGGPRIDSRPWKRAVWEVYRQNWANPGYGSAGDHIGCWYRFTYGAAEFFMLDGRTWRTNPRKPPATMLGPAQKRWLLDGLERSKAMFKVICSPVPMARGTKPGSRDTWDGFSEERQEILDFLAKKKIEGVFVISADRHRSDAWMVERDGAYDLFEFNSSRLTNIHKHRPMKRALFSYNRTPSFGLVHFRPEVEDPAVAYEVVTIDGIKVHRLDVSLSGMR